jgi:hypothetical protein
MVKYLYRIGFVLSAFLVRAIEFHNWEIKLSNGMKNIDR